MAKLNINQKQLSRDLRFKSLSAEQKMKELCYLIELSFLLGAEKGSKKPQGKGKIFRQQKSKID